MEFEKYTMIYKIEQNETNLRIIGGKFVKNNKNKGKFVIKNKKYPIFEGLRLFSKNNKKLKVKMILKKSIYNKSCMFKDCDLLETFSIDYDSYLEDLEKIEKEGKLIENFINISEDKLIETKEEKKKFFGFFYGSEINYFQSSFYDSIEDKKEEKKMDNSTILYMNNNLINSINNITMINELFYNCESLISVQNMAKWNIEYVTEYMERSPTVNH